jgi:glycine/D-amino acid oxidase-like deaminating enzyme
MLCASVFDCIVVGAGVHGSCAAFWLRQRGASVAVLERFAPGHTAGSSHGETRITRSCYHDSGLVDAADRAHREGWPALEQALGRPLRVPTPGVFFGPSDGPLAGYARADVRRAMERVPLDVARARFPLLRFADGDDVLVDHGAAVLLAADTMRALRSWLEHHGASLRWQTRVRTLHPAERHVDVATDGGVLRARAVVLACGPWTGHLHAAGVPPLAVLPQQVGYVDVDAPPAAVAPGAFPVWARIASGDNEFVYGMPSIAGGPLKVARHCTVGTGVDPDAPPAALDGDALMALARARLRPDVLALRHAERCLYTMAPAERLHVIADPDAPIVTIAACSGHSFKFAPLLGRDAADLVAARL